VHPGCTPCAALLAAMIGDHGALCDGMTLDKREAFRVFRRWVGYPHERHALPEQLPCESFPLDAGDVMVTNKPEAGFTIKDAEERAIRMNTTLYQYLDQLRERRTDREPWVCVNERLVQWSLGVSEWMRELFNDAGVGTQHGTSHRFRRTFATHLLRSGTDLATLRDVLGRSDIGVTSRYLGALPQPKASRWPRSTMRRSAPPPGSPLRDAGLQPLRAALREPSRSGTAHATRRWAECDTSGRRTDLRQNGMCTALQPGHLENVRSDHAHQEGLFCPRAFTRGNHEPMASADRRESAGRNRQPGPRRGRRH
jgi:hypothetical protein